MDIAKTKTELEQRYEQLNNAKKRYQEEVQKIDVEIIKTVGKIEILNEMEQEAKPDDNKTE